MCDFYSGVRTVSVSSFWWWVDVKGGAMVSLQWAFLSPPP